jgi:acyl-coenzyme A synthetase/AMP-(fatty) acid ligase
MGRLSAVPRPIIPGPVARLGLLASLDVTAIYQLIGHRYADRELLHLQVPLDYPGYDGLSLTGRQIRDLGFRIAGALAKAGVGANARVVIAKSNHPDYLFYSYSAITVGGIPVSVNAGTGWNYIRQVAERTTARYLLTDVHTMPLTPRAADAAPVRALLQAGLTVLLTGPGADVAAASWAAEGDVRDFGAEVMAAAPAPPPRRAAASDTVVAMFHTSGTTDIPKCCVWTRRNVTRIWKLLLLTVPVTARSRALNAAPCSHALFFALQTMGLLAGAPTYVMSAFEPQEFLATIERRRITHVIAFPYVYMRLAGEDLDAYDLRSMKLWATGADKAHAAHIARLISRGGLRLRPGGPKGSVFVDSYGSTEIGAGGIVQVWGPGSRPVPCLQGKPLPTQFGVRIVDEDWHDVPRGAEGRILVRSTTHFEGYWSDHGTWAANRHDGWWWGGDVGRLGPRGELFFLDREADSVRTESGIVRTLPIEERLLEHPAVMEATVFQGTTDPRTGLGEPVAWVVPAGALTAADVAAMADGGLADMEEQLREWAGTVLPPAQRLEVKVVPLESVPFGVTGKVLKRQLRERAGPSGQQANATEPDGAGQPDGAVKPKARQVRASRQASRAGAEGRAQ